MGTTITSVDGISWTAHVVDPTSPSSPQITGLAYGNGQFLAVGLHGAILTSADGTNWTRQWSGINDNLMSVTYGGGVFVAVGGGRTNTSQVILSSLDGVRWTAQQVLPGQQVLWRVFFASDHFVTAGNRGTFLTSTDGAIWTALKTPFGDRLSGIAYGNGRFVVTGRLGNVLTSTDGLVVLNKVNALAYGNGRFIAFDRHGTLYTSSTGTNWISGNIAPGLADLAFGNGKFVAVGGEYFGTKQILVSTNGQDWTQQRVPAAGDGRFSQQVFYGSRRLAGGANHCQGSEASLGQAKAAL